MAQISDARMMYNAGIIIFGRFFMPAYHLLFVVVKPWWSLKYSGNFYYNLLAQVNIFTSAIVQMTFS